MGDEDEDWTGPVIESTPTVGDRLDTLEAGDPAAPLIVAAVSIEERVARLERIADYLHDAREEAAGLTTSVDALSKRTQSLTRRLTAIEDQQREQNVYQHGRDEEADRRRG